MTDRVSLVVNGRPISAGAGQTLLDAGLASGQAIPHDCATGQCDTCRVRIHSGSVDDAGTRIGDTVLACRARLTADIAIEFDEVPDVARRAGIVDSVVELTAEIVEVTVALRKRRSISRDSTFASPSPACPPATTARPSAWTDPAS